MDGPSPKRARLGGGEVSCCSLRPALQVTAPLVQAPHPRDRFHAVPAALQAAGAAPPPAAADGAATGNAQADAAGPPQAGAGDGGAQQGAAGQQQQQGEDGGGAAAAPAGGALPDAQHPAGAAPVPPEAVPIPDNTYMTREVCCGGCKGKGTVQQCCTAAGKGQRTPFRSSGQPRSAMLRDCLPRQRAGTAPGAAPRLHTTAARAHPTQARHMERERSGELTAKYVQNDGAVENGRLLIGLKNVFSK